MKNSSLVQTLRRQHRQEIISGMFGPNANRGPLGATLAFESDGHVMEEADFQKRVLDGMDATQKKIKTLEDKHAEILKAMPADLKVALEDLTKLKKTANDHQASADAFVKRLVGIEAMMRQHARRGYENPIERIQNDDDLRARFNAMVRIAAFSKQVGFADDGGLKIADARIRDIIEPVVKALGEDTSPGSTLINQRLANEIYDTLATYGVFSTFGVRRVGTKTNIFPVKTARPSAGWINTEAGTIADDTAKAGTTASLSLKPIAVLLNVSLQLLQDAEFDVTADVLDDFAQALAFVLDNTVLNADGTNNSAFGGFSGIFSAATAAPAAAGNITVERTDLEDWTRVLLAVDPIVLARQARWWIHPQIVVRSLSVKDANGRPIFLTALEAPSPTVHGSILGYPITMALAAPSANAASAKVAAFGDPNGYAVPIGLDFQMDSSDDFRWNTLERSFRGWGRAAGGIRRATAISYLQLPAA